MIYLAANYVNYTDPLLGDLNDDIGFGHLQLVKDGFEIEVQAPTGFWLGATVFAGPLIAYGCPSGLS